MNKYHIIQIKNQRIKIKLKHIQIQKGHIKKEEIFQFLFQLNIIETIL